MSSGRRLRSDTEAGRIYLAGLLAWGFIQMPSPGQDVLQIQGAIPACWGCRCKSGAESRALLPAGPALSAWEKTLGFNCTGLVLGSI